MLYTQSSYTCNKQIYFCYCYSYAALLIIGFHQRAQNISEREIPTKKRFRELDIHLTSLRISEIGYSVGIRTAHYRDETVGPTDALVGALNDIRFFNFYPDAIFSRFRGHYYMYDYYVYLEYNFNFELVEKHFLIAGSSSFILSLYIVNDFISPEETECFTLSIFSPEAEESFTCEYEEEVFCEHQICILDSDG